MPSLCQRSSSEASYGHSAFLAITSWNSRSHIRKIDHEIAWILPKGLIAVSVPLHPKPHDVLLAGSIMDNISVFTNDVNHEQVERCARLAANHEEIAVMPMGYQTLVGDMGSSLSHCQKQRALLARALFKNPRILALDEATSHLDVRNEAKVNAEMQVLKLTQIMRCP